MGVIDYDSVGVLLTEGNNAEDKGNRDETQSQRSLQCWYRCNFNYRSRSPENPKPQDDKEIKAASSPAAKSSAPKNGQGRAE